MNRIRLLKNTTDFTDFEDLLHDFLDYAQKYMDLKQVPEIEFVHDEYNGKDILGKTAQYDPNSMEIHVYSYGRHPKDMLRSIAHELVHHMQNEQGRLNVGGYHGQGYAQKNPALREIEKEAMLQSNLCLRDWEDGLKEQKRTIYKEWRNNTMSLKEWKNKELNTLLIEKWGFGKAQEQVEEISEEEVLKEKKKWSSSKDPIYMDELPDGTFAPATPAKGRMSANPRFSGIAPGAKKAERDGTNVPNADKYKGQQSPDYDERDYNNFNKKLEAAKKAAKEAIRAINFGKIYGWEEREAYAAIDNWKEMASKAEEMGIAQPGISGVGEKGKGKGDLDHGDGGDGGDGPWRPKPGESRWAKWSANLRKGGEEFDPAMEERLAKAIAEKLLQNESLLKKLRGK
jgi:hypothetical protein